MKMLPFYIAFFHVLTQKVFFQVALIQKIIIFFVFYKKHLYLCTKHNEIEI